MAIHIKRTAFISLAALSLMASSAYCQTPTEPKLILQNIGLNPTNPTDGFYNANVGVYLDRGPNNQSVSFGIFIPHVRTVDEVVDKLKPAIDDLAAELKKASENFHPPH